MQVTYPAAPASEASIIPPVGAEIPLSTAQRQQLLIQSVLDHSENYAVQPCPEPLKDELSTFASLAYSFYDINEGAFPRLEQGEELQLRLEGDILLTAAQCDPFTLATCDSLTQGLATQQVQAQELMESKFQSLKLLLDVTSTMFKQRTLDGQQAASPPTFSCETRDALQSLHIEIAESASPAQAYACIAGKWGEMERSITAEALLALSLRLQGMRLGLYRAAGQYLSDQAQTLVSNYLVDEDWVGLGENHRGGVMLKSCVEDPFLSRWPNATGLTRPLA